MTGYRIRSLKSDEMGQLTELRTAFMQDPVGTNLEFVPDAQPTLRWQEYVRKHLEEDPRQVLVADDGKRLVGYLLYKTRSDFPITRRYPYATISDIYVMPGYRRRGMATGLMETCLRHLREAGVTHVRIRVLAGNEPATSLYKKFGFLTHELIMELELSS